MPTRPATTTSNALLCPPPPPPPTPLDPSSAAGSGRDDSAQAAASSTKHATTLARDHRLLMSIDRPRRRSASLTNSREPEQRQRQRRRRWRRWSGVKVGLGLGQWGDATKPHLRNLNSLLLPATASAEEREERRRKHPRKATFLTAKRCGGNGKFGTIHVGEAAPAVSPVELAADAVKPSLARASDGVMTPVAESGARSKQPLKRPCPFFATCPCYFSPF
ncbi:hypothetical protein ABZP36_003219 [Zizania latifolia]